MKKIISVLLMLVLLLSLCAVPAMADEVQTITVARQINFVKNGEPFVTYDEAAGGIIYPIMYKDRTYIPVRFIGEKLGIKVSWEEETQTVLMEEGGEVKDSPMYEHGDRTPYEDTAVVADSIKMKFGKYSFNPKEADGTKVYPIMYNDRTYLPARFIASRAGFTVSWDEETQTVGFSSKEEKPKMKILFIGNSYTYVNDLPSMFMKLAEENGIMVTPSSVTGPARKLATYIGSNDEIAARLDYMVKNEKFDVCVVQDFSQQTVYDLAGYIEGTEYVVNKVKPVSDKVVLFAGWGYTNASEWLVNGVTPEQMAKTIEEEHDKMGEKLGVPVARVASVFWECYQRKQQDKLYIADGIHTTTEGTALAMLTIYEKIFGTFPEKTSSLGLSEERVAEFKEVILKYSNK